MDEEKDIDELVAEDSGGGVWLTVREYAEKYGMAEARVRALRQAGKLESKVLKNKDTSISVEGIHILDLPLGDQPVKDKFAHKGAPAYQRTTMKRKPKLDEERKELIKDVYLPRFVRKADRGRMSFTAEELVNIFEIAHTTLYRDWHKWGLRRSKVSEEHRQLSDTPMTGDYCYHLRDIWRFLNGEWEAPEKGTPDDILIGAAEDRLHLEGTYYKYDATKVYPFDGNGVLAWIEDMDIVREDKRKGGWTKFIPWQEQRDFIRNAFTLKPNGDYQYNLILFSAPRGDGKSMAKGSKIIYLDGSVGKVEDVKVGDLLMGPDSTPRKVLALGNGREEMFEVAPNGSGRPFVCNKSHILSLVRKWGENGKKHRIENIHLSDFMKMSSRLRKRYFLYSPVKALQFRPKYTPEFDPYLLGLWTADGRKNTPSFSVNKKDVEIEQYLYEEARRLGEYEIKIGNRQTNSHDLRLTYRGSGTNPLTIYLKNLGVLHDKHIPQALRNMSEKDRLLFLAGYIDGDGSKLKGNADCYSFSSSRKAVFEGIVFICRSLGFSVSERERRQYDERTGKTYTSFVGIIGGDIDRIPCRLERKRIHRHNRRHSWNLAGIKSIRSLGEGEYYGVVLDGDHLYLLENFTVTHNTYLVAVLTLFRFFNRYGETINLSGNSKDQVSFAHYDLCKKIIQNTPKLKDTPGLAIKEKSIALMAGPKEAVCQIKAIPTSTGLLPGTTCAVFTELHNLEDRKFFIDLWTSTRATPNAMVLVDTTVAEPGHIVYELWESFQRGDDPLLYFHHYADKHCNPETTPEQLNSFRRHMFEQEYNRYFRNRWEDATGGVFSPNQIKEIGYCGVDGIPGPSPGLRSAIKEVLDLEGTRNTMERGKVDLATVNAEIRAAENRIMKVDPIYKLPATSDDLDALSRLFGCNFIIGVGLDRAQMIGVAPDRTVLTCVARGIVDAETSYYFILDMFIPRESTLTVLTEKILEWTIAYGWIDRIVIESYLGQDFHSWCTEHGYDAEMVYPSFKAQKPIFASLYQLTEHGYLKSPKVPYYTDEDGGLYRGYSTKDDIFREELRVFSYKVEKWFGSPQKRLKGGIKDDTIYSLAWAIYATQGDAIPLGPRGTMKGVGGAVMNRDVIGEYRK